MSSSGSHESRVPTQICAGAEATRMVCGMPMMPETRSSSARSIISIFLLVFLAMGGNYTTILVWRQPSVALFWVDTLLA